MAFEDVKAEIGLLLAQMQNKPEDAHELYLQLMENTADAALDAQGRITIPPHLARHAGIKKEVLFVGAGDVTEMWDPGTYRKYVGGSEKDFDAWMTNYL